MQKTETAVHSGHSKIYWVTGIALIVLTAVTVWASSWETAVGAGVLIALVIAAVKGSLVASFFMHLVTEKKLILIVLLVTFFFLLALIFLPLSDSLVNVGVPNVP